MATASYLIADMQAKLGDPLGNVYTSANLLNWLNEAQKDFCMQQLALRTMNATDVQHGQTYFGVASDRIMIEFAATRVQIPKVLRHVTPTEYFAQVGACPGAVSIDPEIWTEINDNIYVYPAYGRDSASTALPFDIGPVQTTIEVFDTASFTASGNFRIGGPADTLEYITYDSKDASHFFGCVRGASGTNGQSHDGNLVTGFAASVVQGQHFWTMYRKLPTVLMNMTDTPEIREAWHEHLEYYAMYLAYAQTGESDKASDMYDTYTKVMKEIKWAIAKETLSTMSVHDLETMARPTMYGPRG